MKRKDIPQNSIIEKQKQKIQLLTQRIDELEVQLHSVCENHTSTYEDLKSILRTSRSCMAAYEQMMEEMKAVKEKYEQLISQIKNEQRNLKKYYF